MFGSHFYHATMRKSVAVFGTLFNNISVIRHDGSGNILNQIKVPLAYGPKQKFLARIDGATGTQGSMAIKLPRMSFEISGIELDTASKLPKRTEITENNSSGTVKNTIKQVVAYNINMSLNIMAKNQDDGLQILEQILPYFQPEYTLTIKPVSGFDFKQDVPIVLNSTSIADDYEGDFVTRRVLVYTLDFTMKMKFYGPTGDQKIIREIDVDLSNLTNTDVFYESVGVTPNPIDAINPAVLSTITTIDPLNLPRQFSININAATLTGTFGVGETILGTTSASGATVVSYDSGVLVVSDPDGFFYQNESIVGQTSGATATVITAV
jgi:hypothetical protein